jgi:transcription antitermination factor NusB
MGIRYLARQRVLQFLYALDHAAPDEPLEQVERRFLAMDPSQRRGWGPFARKLAEEVHAHKDELDAAIKPLLRNWTLERLPRLDLLCLRMALCELRTFPEIPLRVTINEYIELARLFSTDDSPQYINAVLDQLAKEFPEKDFQVGEDHTAP